MNPHFAFPDVDFRTLEAELVREWRQRQQHYPERVAKGNMTPADADRQVAIAEAWVQDAARIKLVWFGQWDSPAAKAQLAERGMAPRHGVSWHDRRTALLRELELRRRTYPTWVNEGRILERVATRQLQCLECLLAIYEDGWDWTGSDGGLPGGSPLAATEYATLRAEIDARRVSPQRQQHYEREVSP